MTRTSPRGARTSRPHALDRLSDVFPRVAHIVVPADRHRSEARQVADDYLRGIQQLCRQLPVRHDDDANHAFILFQRQTTMNSAISALSALIVVSRAPPAWSRLMRCGGRRDGERAP